GLFTIGKRIAFMIVLASALLLFGGWRSIQLSFTPYARERSYFGVYTVRDFIDVRTLAHGTTLHGIQLKGEGARPSKPTSYYAPGSGVGLAMGATEMLYGGHARVGVVGLGTGTLACYARPGQS